MPKGTLLLHPLLRIYIIRMHSNKKYVQFFQGDEICHSFLVQLSHSSAYKRKRSEFVIISKYVKHLGVCIKKSEDMFLTTADGLINSIFKSSADAEYFWRIHYTTVNLFSLLTNTKIFFWKISMYEL